MVRRSFSEAEDPPYAIEAWSISVPVPVHEMQPRLVHPTARTHTAGRWRRRPSARDPRIGGHPNGGNRQSTRNADQAQPIELHYGAGADSNVDPRRRGRADGADVETRLNSRPSIRRCDQ